MPCFPPCLTHAIDGIFRPGGGRLGDGFEDVQELLPEQGRIGLARGLRGRASGGHLFG